MVRLKFLFFTLVIGTLLATATIVGGTVKADQFDAQINALNQQNAAAQAQSSSLAATAASYQAAIDQLSVQISGLQSLISQTQAKIDDLNNQIAQAQAQLAQEKKILGENIKTMYLEGDVSTLEILAGSKNLSDFVNKQQYRNSVADKIKTSVDKINVLKAELQKQQSQQQQLLKSQQDQQSQLQSSETQQTAMLNYTEGQKSAYDQQISSNNSQIASLRAQQIAANRRLVSSGNVSIVSTGSCGGSYPGDVAGPFGHWGCNYYQDSAVDNWGMLNRECVSYTAWRVNQAYGDMPYWGNLNANADHWPADAAGSNIPMGSTPKVGSVAIGTNPNWFGSVGHAMWVEAVSGGQILVSQYNFSAPGQYSEMWISTSLISTFIYFGG
jgi:peptidoglycan DL-endopeptidase CwlO